MAFRRVLLVYYTRTGNTKKVARAIWENLRCDTEELEDQANRKGFLGYLSAGRDAMMKNKTHLHPVTKDPSLYDLVIVGTPVWAWNMTPAVRTYLTQYRDEIKEGAFFTVSEVTGPERIVREMESILGKKALAWTGFTGKEIADGSYLNKAKEFLAEIHN